MSSHVDPRALAAEVAPLIADALAKRVEPEFVDAEGARTFLGLPSAKWVLEEARHDRIPHRRFGHYVRFSLGELRAWADARGKGPKR
jgi:hypothetical protein